MTFHSARIFLKYYYLNFICVLWPKRWTEGGSSSVLFIKRSERVCGAWTVEHCLMNDASQTMPAHCCAKAGVSERCDSRKKNICVLKHNYIYCKDYFQLFTLQDKLIQPSLTCTSVLMLYVQRSMLYHNTNRSYRRPLVPWPRRKWNVNRNTAIWLTYINSPILSDYTLMQMN
jgi:hypothetical protein